jgi:hypothetical protein
VLFIRPPWPLHISTRIFGQSTYDVDFVSPHGRKSGYREDLCALTRVLYYGRALIFFIFIKFYYYQKWKKRHEKVATLHSAYVNPRPLLQSQYLEFIPSLASENQRVVLNACTVMMLSKYWCRLYQLIKTVTRTIIKIYTDLWPWPWDHDFCTAIKNALKGHAHGTTTLSKFIMKISHYTTKCSVQELTLFLAPCPEYIAVGALDTRSDFLVKKFPAFYGTWRFITAFTRACHLSDNVQQWIQITKFVVMQCYLSACHFLLLESKWCFHYSVLKHP